MRRLTLPGERLRAPGVGAAADGGPGPGAEGTRHTLTYGRYRLAYEVYGSGDRVLVWLHGLLLDASLSRGLARRLAAKGNRVVLLDLLGHGRSDKPRHAGPHRMDLYAEQVLCLLDELGLDQVVLGGVSLGTNVSLLATVQAPERVRGLVLEMPVLEWAAPAAALVFAPLLLEVHYARAVLRLASRVAARLPSSGLDGRGAGAPRGATGGTRLPGQAPVAGSDPEQESPI
jgi:pimeloyl-ACP methyl ester carboxylesterase